MMIIKEVLLQLFVNVFDKKIQVVLLNLHGQILQQINEIKVTKNVIKMYSLQNEGRSVVAERCIRALTLKNKIYNYMTSISKKRVDDKVLK